MKCADGIERDLHPIGTRINLVSHPEVTGQVVGYEWSRLGVASPIPYRVQWDDDRIAREHVGILGVIYQCHESVEKLNSRDAAWG